MLCSSRVLSLLDTERHSLRHLKQIHAQLLLSGALAEDPFAAGHLVASCFLSNSSSSSSSSLSILAYGAKILTSLENPNVFSWNVAVRGFAGCSRPAMAVSLYGSMLRRSGARPDRRTYPFLFKACTRMPDLVCGLVVLGHALQVGVDSDVFVVNALVHFFAVCGRLEDARRVFDESCSRDLVSWNTMIGAYVRRGLPREALRLFREMEADGVRPDEVTVLAAVSCCAQLRDLDLGKSFHRYIELNGLRLTVALANALMDMYVKCGSLEPAKSLFDGIEKRTVVSWTTMIVGYANFGLMGEARRVFDEMPGRDVFPWNALMAGYVRCKQGKEAVALFHEMQASGVEPDEVTMIVLLSACSQLGALEMGLWVHHYIDRRRLSLSVALGTALVDMYAKCGNIEKAIRVFRDIPEKNALTWTAMICGLASHGHAEDAIEHFQKMMDLGLQPDEVTFIGVLSACCHAGLVNEGREFFAQMTSKHRLQRKMKHYSCMIDLLGRAGYLDEAEELVNSMPMEPDAVVWGALFFACRMHGNVSLGEKSAMKLVELDPSDSGIYVLLANMYAEANMRKKADKVRIMMRHLGVEKTPGCSCVEVNGTVHEFIVRDNSHPDASAISECVNGLTRQMRHTKSMVNVYASIE